jgi:hypothetical protein
MNHTWSIVLNTVTDFDISGYPQHWTPDILPLHQPPQEEGEQPVVQQRDLLPQDPKVEQVVLDEFVLSQVAQIHMHQQTLAYTPEIVPSTSNPTFELGISLGHYEHLARP